MPDTFPNRAHRFQTTRWSMIVAARQGAPGASRDALESLCRTYWYPLYAFVRRGGRASAEAQDLTQEFFARLLEKGWIKHFDRERGRFRTFLLTAMTRFLTNEWRRSSAAKRHAVGGVIPLDSAEAEQRFAVEPALSPDQVFEHRWAMTLLQNATARLELEYRQGGRAVEFDRLKDCLTAARGEIPYEQFASALKMETGAVRVAVHRLRKRFRELLRQEVAETVDGPEALEEELRYLAAVLSRPTA